MILATINHTITLSLPAPMLLSEILFQAGVRFPMPCGRNGICGKCKVLVQGALSPPDETELAHLTDEQRRLGYRLACRAKAIGDVSLVTEDAAMAINRTMQSPAPSSPLTRTDGLILDIGTTTVAGVLLQNGEPVLEISEPNRQLTFGADVISRIQAEKEHSGVLYKLLQAQVTDILAKCSHPADAVIVANTVMLHFLTGCDVAPLGEAPYRTADLFGKEYLLFGTKCYLPPCISAFVGADITAGILASRMTEQPGTAMLVDLGTNGELVYFDGETLTAASTAAGPAFEGAGIFQGMPAQEGAIDHVFYENDQIRYTTIGSQPAKGFCGSGLVDVLAVMKQCGALEESGTLNPAHPLCRRDFHGKTCFSLPGCDVILRAGDVRKLQVAKAAIHAGMLTLAKRVDTLYLAGGFGAYLNPKNAEYIGLFPKDFCQNIQFLGNAALSGGRELLVSEPSRTAAQDIAKRCRTCEFSGNPAFSEYYIDKMLF